MQPVKALFIARKDIAYTLRDRTTLIWLLVMPVLFFYFIGTATGGASGGDPDTPDNIALLLPDHEDFLAVQLGRRLADAGFNVVTFDAGEPSRPLAGGDPEIGFDRYCRRLEVPGALANTIAAGEPVTVGYTSCSDELGAEFDKVRVQRAVYTTLADIIAADAEGMLSAAGIARLNTMPRAMSLSVRAAGKKRTVPSGFEQAVPGTMVLFTMVILLTSGAISLLQERRRGLLRRLASAPMSRTDVVLGKWLGKMALALVQIVIAMLMGALLFGIRWQPDLAMILVLLTAWAGFCTALALLLGSLGRTEGQVSGIGVMSAMALGGLGGCWWPIEVAPGWMQQLAGFLPTGWTMNGLHRLMSFEAGAASVLGELVLLILASIALSALAVRFFRYD